MKRDTFIFFRSIRESIKYLDPEYQLEVYNLICDYAFDGVIPENISGVARAIFTMAQPLIDSTNAKYTANVENGKKGGRPRKNEVNEKTNNNPAITQENPTKTQENPNETQSNPDETLNDKCKMINDKCNMLNNNNIFILLEKEIKRTLNSIECEKIEKWVDIFDVDVIKAAIEISKVQDKISVGYIDGILANWKRQGKTCVDHFKNGNEDDKLPFSQEDRNLLDSYDWLNDRMECAL